MKKYIPFACYGLLLLLSLYSKEMNLYKNFTGAEEFSKLKVEEQYASYMNSFKDIIDPRDQPLKWAKRMIEQYGDDFLPLIDRDLETVNFDNLFRAPYDCSIELISYLLDVLKSSGKISRENVIYYGDIFKQKLEEYILRYRIIDGTVRVAISCINYLINLPVNFPNTSKGLKEYYEEKLGIRDIIAGDLDSYWVYK